MLRSFCRVVLCTCVLATGCGGGDARDEGADPARSDVGTSEAPSQAATDGTQGADLNIAFASPCDAVDSSALEEVLGGPADETDTWKPGDKEPSINFTYEDYGCAYSTTPVDSGTGASISVASSDNDRFATARAGAGQVRGANTCEEEAGVFGEQSFRNRCTDGKRVTFQDVALAGPSVFSCIVQGGEDQQTRLEDQATEFCTAVAEALSR